MADSPVDPPDDTESVGELRRQIEEKVDELDKRLAAAERRLAERDRAHDEQTLQAATESGELSNGVQQDDREDKRMMTDQASVVLPLNCPECGGPIDVACEEPAADQAQTIRFLCPYCQAPREFDAPGRVLWVAMRQHGAGPETKH